MLSVATGMIFQFMIARAVAEQSEYDVWFNVGDVLGYFCLLAAVFPFWTMRFVARKKEGAAKTGILVNIIISTIATIIYLSLAPLIVPPIISALGLGEQYGKYFFLYLLASIQIVETYSIYALEACLQAKMPETVGYGLLIGQISKVVLGYILINELQQSLQGAMISIIAAYTIQIIYYFKLLSDELKQKVTWTYLKEWVKGSTLNIFNMAGNQIAAFIFIILLVYGGEAARSNYGMAALIAGVIGNSSLLAFALYPKLLAERNYKDITTSLKMVLMFAIPMTAGAIALSDSYLVIFKDWFKEASPVLVVLAIDALIGIISGIFVSVLFGVEKVDEKAKISFKELAKSRMFIAFSLPYLHSAITLPTTFFVLTTYAQSQPLQAALYVSVINSLARFAMFLILYTIVRKMIKIHIPWKNIAKYVFASVVMASILFLIPHPTRLSSTLGITAIGAIIYLALLMVIDEEAWLLAKSVLQEIRFKFK